MQILRMRMTFLINPGSVIETDRVDDQGISFPFTDRVAHISGIQILGMSPPVGVDLAHDVVALEEHDHPARNLDDLLWVGNEHDAGYAGRKTTNGRVRVRRPECGLLELW